MHSYFDFRSPLATESFGFSHVIEGTLQCQSPQQLVSLLRRHLNPHVPSSSRARLRILDIAAGNGRVGVELRSQLGKTPGIERLMATDLLDSAKTAALRDRETSLYDEYIVADLTQPKIVQRFRGEGFNVATICAALGSGDGDLPLEVIDTAIEILQSGGVLAFTVNEGAGGDVSARYGEFLDCVRRDADGTHWGNMRKIEMERYRHRLNVKGEWIVYTALLYQKMV